MLHVAAEQGEILVNGAPAGALPIRGPIRVVASSVDVVVRAPGHVDAHRVIDVAVGAEVNEEMALGPETPAPPLAVSSPSPVSDARPATRSPVAGYVTLGAAGVLAIGGVVAWTVRESAVSTWNDDSRCLKPGSGSRQQQCGTYQDTANVALGLEIGAFALSAVGAGVGIWLLWPASSPSTGSSAWCAPGVTGVLCGGAF